MKHLSTIQTKDIINSYYKREIVEKNSKIHSWIWHDYERMLSQLNQKLFFLKKEEIMLEEGVPNSATWSYITQKINFLWKKTKYLKKLKIYQTYHHTLFKEDMI